MAAALGLTSFPPLGWARASPPSRTSATAATKMLRITPSATVELPGRELVNSKGLTRNSTGVEIRKFYECREMRITSAESAVMEVLWADGPKDAEEVTGALAKSQGWTETTVRTLLSRLVQKKAVAK